MAEKKQSDRSGEGVAEAPVKQPRSGWGSKFIWGGLLIAIGVILLLNNLGVVSVELSSFLRLWPVLIIGAGISLLSLRGWLAGLVYGLATIGVIALVWAILVGPFSQQADANTREDFHIARESSSVESAAISLSGGAASFHIGVHGDEDVVRGTLRSDVAELHRFSSVRGTTQQVELELDSQWRLWSGGGNNLDVKLTDQLPIDLSIDSGATSIDATCRQSSFVRSLSIAAQVR